MRFHVTQADEIKRLREQVASLQATAGYETSIAQLKIAEAAAFLDRLAERIERVDVIDEAAADCRAMAEKLRK